MYIVTKEQLFCGAFATIEDATAAIETKIQRMNSRTKKSTISWILTNTITEIEAPNYGAWPVDGQCAKFHKQLVYEKYDSEDDVNNRELYDDTYFTIFEA